MPMLKYYLAIKDDILEKSLAIFSILDQQNSRFELLL